MAQRSPVARLTDIVEAIELIQSDMAGVTLGNVLRHEYEDVAHDVLWHVVHDNLPPLKTVCLDELVAARQADK